MPTKRYCLHLGCGEPLAPQYPVANKHVDANKKASLTDAEKPEVRKRKK